MRPYAAESPYCIVMEYVEGGTLNKPKRAEKLTFTGIANLMAQVADAVHFAHTRGLIHRDIKPTNILLDTSGDPKVADFGLAIHESEQPAREGELSGTSYYMSPEQARRETEHLDGRTDVWSMGATLYELLTGRRPFLGGTWGEVKKQLLHRQVKPPRQINDAIPEELERICLKALNKEQKDRYSTARGSTAMKTRRNSCPWVGSVSRRRPGTSVSRALTTRWSHCRLSHRTSTGFRSISWLGRRTHLPAFSPPGEQLQHRPSRGPRCP